MCAKNAAYGGTNAVMGKEEDLLQYAGRPGSAMPEHAAMRSTRSYGPVGSSWRKTGASYASR